MTSILLWTLIISGIIYLGFALYLHTGMIQLRPVEQARNIPVSVLVTAHNEESALPACVESLLTQEYPVELTEIILIDDRSEDLTGAIMESYASDHDHVQVLHIDETPEEFSPKKYALTRGMNLATGEWIVTTDADCTPPPSWLAKFAGYASLETGMLIGPAPLQPDGTFISKMSALNALAADSIAAGTAGWNRAVQSTGRNFGYRKQLLREIHGYKGIEHVLSGDDTLLLHKARTSNASKAVFIADPDVAVPSAAPRFLHERVRQRRRHVSGSRYFPLPVKIGYFMHHLSNSILWVGMGISFFTELPVIIPLGLLAGKFLLDYSLLRKSANFTRQHSLLRWFLPWEIYYFLEQITISPLGLLGKIRWD